jgi:choline dehydrogenase-like flavoprotein
MPTLRRGRTGTVLLKEASAIARAPADQVVDVLCGIAPEVEERERLLGFVTAIQPLPPPDGEEAGYVALRDLTRNLRRGIWPDDLMGRLSTVLTDLDGTTNGVYQRFFARPELLRLRVHVEVAPNPESRVILIDERDALGLNRVRLNWQLTEFDRLSLRRSLEIVATTFGAKGFGRLRLADWLLEEGFAIPGNGSYHHAGTTRMSDDPRSGVVDRNCRVHGMHNLFVAGSSVFPTEGFANPTLTIVALGLRLADHLKTLHV